MDNECRNAWKTNGTCQDRRPHPPGRTPCEAVASIALPRSKDACATPNLWHIPTTKRPSRQQGPRCLPSALPNNTLQAFGCGTSRLGKSSSFADSGQPRDSAWFANELELKLPRSHTEDAEPFSATCRQLAAKHYGTRSPGIPQERHTRRLPPMPMRVVIFGGPALVLQRWSG